MEQNTFLFLLYLGDISLVCIHLGKNAGVRMASARAIDMLIAMGVLKELPKTKKLLEEKMMNDHLNPSVWTKMYEPKQRTFNKNAERMMQSAQDPNQSYWEKVYTHPIKSIWEVKLMAKEDVLGYTHDWRKHTDDAIQRRCE